MSDLKVTPCLSLPVPKPVGEMTDDERSAFAEQIVTVIFGATPVDDAIDQTHRHPDPVVPSPRS